MLTQEQAVEIQVLHRQGRSIAQIMRETGLSRNTVRKYLRGGGQVKYGPRESIPNWIAASSLLANTLDPLLQRQALELLYREARKQIDAPL